MPEIGTILTYASGVGVVFEWKIENFFNLPETDGAYYCSPHFSFGGERWRMDIFPSGSDSPGHVDLRLEKWTLGRSIKQSFSISLKTERREKYNEQHATKNFDMYNRIHGFIRFIPRSELSRRRFELMPEGHLTVICTMKSSPSAGNESNTASTFDKCCHCKITFKADSLSSHQKKCMHRPVKCPDCFEAVVLQTWLDEHECQEERPEAHEDYRAATGKEHKENSENTSVNASTQTEEKDSDGSLCQDFKKLLLEGLNHDLILKVGDKELRAHRDVLRVRSQVFKSMLDHDMKEKKSGIIDIPDCDPLAMEQFLFYVYSGNMEMLDQSNMLNLYYIADKYEMKGLKKDCSDFIKESLSQANICDVIQLALNHSDSSLLESTTVYFRSNMLGIMRTVEWQVFMKENSTAANELLIKAVEKLSNVTC